KVGRAKQRLNGSSGGGERGGREQDSFCSGSPSSVNSLHRSCTRRLYPSRPWSAEIKYARAGRFAERQGRACTVGEEEDMTLRTDDLAGVDDFIAEHALARRALLRHLGDESSYTRSDRGPTPGGPTSAVRA